MQKKQIKGIDSMRAVGVVLVVCYHLFPKVLPAGFFGVDVFFVISGFLITSLFVKELANTKRIHFIGFFVRRVQRLLPAVFFMVIVMLSLTLLTSPDLRVGLREQTAAVFGWVTNWFEIAGGQSYEEQFLPRLFVHTWTLSVEVQYYLVWGLAVFIIVACWGTSKKKLSSCRLWMSLIAIIFVALSYGWMQHIMVGVEDPSPAYYATTSRIFPLMIGSALGAMTGMRSPKRSPHVALSIAGLVVCVITICYMARKLSFSDPFTYKGGILIVSMLAAFSIWLVLALQPKKWFRDVKLLKIIGKRSYSIYLFHWPIYVLFKQIVTAGGGPFPWKITQPVYAGLSLLCTVGIAEISYRCFEQRLVAGKKRPKMTRRFAGCLAIACVALCCLSVLTIVTVPNRSHVEDDYMRQKTLVNIHGMNRYGDYLAGLTLSPVAVHGKTEQLPPAPSQKIVYENRESILPLTPSGAGWTNDGQWINVFGDSVTLGAADTLLQTLQTVFVDAQESRNMGAAIDLMHEWEAKGQLTNYIVLALFTNTQNFTQESTVQFLDAVPDGTRVIVVTPYGNDSMEFMAEWLRGLPAQYPYVIVADWNLAIRNRVELLAPDGMHMHSNDGKQLYANIIGKAIEKVSSKPAKG
ncbi:MAG: acyltransferase [Clostridiales Family XIII bacterium]|jgi:peptidoglycan/LPS O-acetylase OafA/YrhL|nr:acyltransferase [Clostridiales Family XIII bacterium]